jgi:acetyl-CoA carboxylase carboxyl transferase beta subunit
MTPMSARGRIAELFDSFEEFDHHAEAEDPIDFPGYLEAQNKARSASGEREAVVTGVATIEKRRAVAAIFEFAFMGGSMGREAGLRLESAMKRAAELAIPFICLTSSGGARMQEGMAALAQMPRTVAASLDLSRRGIPRITILGHPTTGGVYASFASLADVLIAEDGATIGFAGPRVVEGLTGISLPDGSHTARAALEAGLIDAVLPQSELKKALSSLLEVLSDDDVAERTPGVEPADIQRPPSAWSEFELARRPDRPPPSFYISKLFDPVFELHGDRAGADDRGVAAGIARFERRKVAFAALDRASPTAAGFRKARRLIEMAGRLGLRVVTFVDTPGADPSFESEYAGLASAIASTFEAMLSAPVPTIAAVTGEGGSGGALALACADVVGIQEHAVFSVIAPEGAAEILYRSTERAAEVAEDLRPTSWNLRDLGLADDIIAEPGEGAHSDSDAAAAFLRNWLSRAIDTAGGDLEARAARYRT